MNNESQEGPRQRAHADVKGKFPPGVRIVRTLEGHAGTIGRFAWSPSGKFIASPSFDSTIRIWNLSTGDVRQLKGSDERAVAVSWAPDGKRIISAAGEQSIRLWDVETGAIIRRLDRSHQRAITTLAWSPDGRYFASSGADGKVVIWDAVSFSVIKEILQGSILTALAWSHAGDRIATGGMGRDVPSIYHVDGWRQVTPTWLLRGKVGKVYGIVWSNDDKHLFCSRADSVITKLSLEKPEVTRLEGHTGEVKALTCTADGLLIASKGGVNDNSIRIWRTDQLAQVCRLWESSTHSWRPTISFHPSAPILATLTQRERAICIWELDPSILLRQPIAQTITYTSAKVVVVGESNVGKSYLAHRIASGAPPNPGEIKSTHGMKFWPLEPIPSNPASTSSTDEQGLPTEYSKRLFGHTAVSQSQRRDIILWDMGGQDEYRLVHQLFLGDTTVALVLLDPTRGMTAFREAEAWSKSLEKQLRGRAAVKLLVGTKVDQPSETIDRKHLERLRQDCQFADYCETSAITGRGVAELCEALATAIDWDDIGKTSRPELFQRIRDEIEARRKRGEVVLRVTELEDAISKHDMELQKAVSSVVEDLVSRKMVKVTGQLFELNAEIVLPGSLSAQSRRSIDLMYQAYEELQSRWAIRRLTFDLADIQRALTAKDSSAVAEQLAAQGLIARSKVSTGEPVLVLQVQEIERYAGSLILAARNNPRGVPALELRAVAQDAFSLPGIAANERLPREQEKPVLECTVQLMLEHGICFQHEGLLIFPSLFAPGPETADMALPHAVSLYYDFAGAIDNIYASLVAWLVLAKEFGNVRLWSGRVEFEMQDGGLCGLRKVGRPGGFAHVDVYFEVETPEPRRREFISFVEDHLARNGVEVCEHVTIKCTCGHEFAEQTLRQRIARGDKDVMCPVCEKRHSLTEGAAVAREQDPRITQHTWALRTHIEKLREKVTKQVVQVLSQGKEAKRATAPIRLLHLSDLHFTKDTPVSARLQWLLDDLKQDGGLGFKELDYLVISGDFTDKGSTEGLEKAYQFVSGLTGAFGLSAERCIFVPGNHDVRDLREAYEWREKPDGLKDGEWVKQGEIILVRNAEKYPLRLKSFSDAFYHKFVQQPYPLACVAQGMAIAFWETGVQFLALNSCWQIDQFNRKRSGLNVEAVANAIKQAQKQEEDGRKAGQLEAGNPVLRIAVWHHAVAGPDQMRDTEFLGNLQKNGVRLALHGDVHEERRDLIRHWTKDKVHVLGSGSFGARPADRPESSPRLYNVLEIARDLKSARVHTRCQPKPDGPWKGWNEWPMPGGGDGAVPYYDITW